MKSIVLIGSLFISACLAQAETGTENCGKISFPKTLSCEKPSVNFDVSGCDKTAPDSLPATKAACDRGELIAELDFNNHHYTATLVKYVGGDWSQKGDIVVTKNSTAAQTVAAKPAAAKPKVKKAEKPVVKPEPTKVVEAAVTKSAPEPVKENTGTPAEPTQATEKPEGWKFDFSGYFAAEQEVTQNFGDFPANNFDSKDSNSDQTNTNILSNLQLNISKSNLKFESLLEIGEVFYGDSTTGGEQGLRSRIIELRNFDVEQNYTKNWSTKVGLWTVNADPRGFVLSDNYSGAQIKHETEKGSTSLWYVRAIEAHPPTTDKIRDTYVGLNQILKPNDKLSYNFFATYRSTKETFYDQDLATNTLGLSQYYWLGMNSVQSQIFDKTNLEYNLILNQSQFKSDDGLSKDNNSSWLGHIRLDREINSQVSLGLDALATSGSSDAQVSGVSVLGKRKGYATVDPSQAYLLTIATSDSVDDTAGSVRTTTRNHIGRLDLSEGLRIGVLSVNYKLNDEWEFLARYGFIKTGSENSSTHSTHYGDETDVRIRYNATAITSWTLEAGQFNPGDYFVNRDSARLISLKYKVIF